MYYAVKTERVNTQKYIDSMNRGMRGKIVSYQELLNSTDCEKVTFMGVLRGTNLVYNWANKIKKIFIILIDLIGEKVGVRLIG